MKANHGVTLTQVGCVLERMVRKFMQNESEVDGKYRILTRSGTKGYQECPFEELDAEECTYGRYTMVIEQMATGKRFKYESLVAHLVKDHNFCEGPGTEYRLDLEGAIRFFEIDSDAKSSLEKVESIGWSMRGSRIGSLEQLEPLAVAKFTSGQFLALLLPFQPPLITKFDPEIPLLESLYRYYLESELQLELGVASGEIILIKSRPLRTRAEIEAVAQDKIDTIRKRKESYQHGNFMGCSLILIAAPHFDYPVQGLSVEKIDRSMRFKIPELNFDRTESFFRIPSIICYNAEKKVYYL
jgi:hypothetical protein